MKNTELAALALALLPAPGVEVTLKHRLRLLNTAEKAMVSSFFYASRAANCPAHLARANLAKQDEREDDCLARLLALELSIRPGRTLLDATALATGLLETRADCSLEELFFDVVGRTV